MLIPKKITVIIIKKSPKNIQKINRPAPFNWIKSPYVKCIETPPVDFWSPDTVLGMIENLTFKLLNSSSILCLGLVSFFDSVQFFHRLMHCKVGPNITSKHPTIQCCYLCGIMKKFFTDRAPTEWMNMWKSAILCHLPRKNSTHRIQSWMKLSRKWRMQWTKEREITI